MGYGIAEVAAVSGLEVFLADVSGGAEGSVLEEIRRSLSRLAEEGLLEESVDAVMSRVKLVRVVGGEFSGELAKALSESDFMIEAAPESIELKRRVFAFADEHMPAHAVMATSTGGLLVSEVAAATRRPERVVGMHFLNPPQEVPLVEVVRGERTSDEALQLAVELARRFGKQPVVVKRDVPGFIVNRVLARFLNTACWLVAKGVASIVEVDGAARYRLGLPMGAFEFADYAGVDLLYQVWKAMAERGFKVHLCPLYREKLEKKEYGVRAGRGFYQYPAPGEYARPGIPGEAGGRVDPVILIAPAVNEGAWLLRNGVAEKEDIDKAVRLGLGWPRGVFEYADDYGVDAVVEALKKLREETGFEEYDPDPLLIRMVGEGRTGRKAGRGFYEYRAEEIVRDTIIVRIEEPIAWVVLNRPRKLNALNPQMVRELSETLDMLEDRDDVRVVVLRGEGRAFSAGADVTALANATPIEAARFARRLQELTLKMQFYTKPIIAALHGYVLGGGLGLALSADIRVASEDAVLGQPEVSLGLVPGAGATQRLPRLIGRGRAKELILTGRTVTAREAERMGLVERVVPPGRLEEEARRLALELAGKPPLALMAAKHALEYGLESSIWAGLALESQLFSLLLAAEDARGGAPRPEGREPRFKRA
ncbi:3-hydroxyacyl-CoA dehydrogenase/enoyl-CoA hydratase family protein [Stetteria hydrogenophila]